jgi:hypothetical protein
VLGEGQSRAPLAYEYQTLSIPIPRVASTHLVNVPTVLPLAISPHRTSSHTVPFPLVPATWITCTSDQRSEEPAPHWGRTGPVDAGRAHLKSCESALLLLVHESLEEAHTLLKPPLVVVARAVRSSRSAGPLSSSPRREQPTHGLSVAMMGRYTRSTGVGGC